MPHHQNSPPARSRRRPVRPPAGPARRTHPACPTDRPATPAEAAAGLPAPLAWALECLGEYFSDAPAAFHAELMRDLEHGERRLLARVAPRGHGKSVCAALAYPLWCILRGTRRNIVIITHEISLARQFVRDIRTELESNEHILAACGDLCTAPPATGAADRGTRGTRRGRWSEEMFTTCTGVTVQARSVGTSFRGTRVGPHRPDLIICDDIEKDELVRSPASRAKLEHWLRKVVMPALAPEGRLLVLGSILHHDCLLASLADRKRWPRWDYKVYRALEARPNANGEYVLEALWPARWPVQRLNEERERIGTLAFEQEYMANPIDESRRVFRPEWLKRYDPAELEARSAELVNLMAVDPATGARGGDYFALWVGSLDPATGVIYTRELRLERIGFVEQVRRIVQAFERWRPVRVGIETTAYQVALKQTLEEESRKRGLYMPVVPIVAVSHKIARIEGVAPLFENGTFRLPPVLDPQAESQFLHFPQGRHDDAPDVCAMGIELARSLRTGSVVEGMTAGRGRFEQRGAW
jgi:predicted phage terminase large subunit-like protein